MPYSSTVQIHSRRPVHAPVTARRAREIAKLLENHLRGAQGGTIGCEGVVAWVDGAAAARAWASLTMATSSGTVGITINGVAVTVTWATSDAASQTLLVAAIAASTDALVQYLVEASNTRGSATLVSFPAGASIALGDWTFTAEASASGEYGKFDISGSDTADAAALAAAINAHPAASKYFGALSVAGACSIFQFATPPSGNVAIKATDTAATVVQFVAAAVSMIRAISPGVAGNCVTTAASGTNVTASAARLALGLGNNVTPTVGVP